VAGVLVVAGMPGVVTMLAMVSGLAMDGVAAVAGFPFLLPFVRSRRGGLGVMMVIVHPLRRPS
jgi:hypothetical protein